MIYIDISKLCLNEPLYSNNRTKICINIYYKQIFMQLFHHHPGKTL